jgi:hypothetical protein
VTLLIEDSARNTVPGWTLEAVSQGVARGVVLSPFTTPRTGNGYKGNTRAAIERLRDGGAEVWFDPETHALQMPAVGDFRYYDDWPLWNGARGQLASDGDMRDHVERVFAEQDRLGAPHLAPTILLHAPQSTTSQRALDLARIAIDIDPDCRLAVAGDPAFWAGGQALDAHVGALAQFEPGGWWVTVVRNLAYLPVQAIPEEIHGLCRTVRALSEDGPVHVSHGDLAGLPGVAAGATTLGTGWDARQRVCSYQSYEERGDGSDGGSWFKQATLEGLLSQMTQGEYQVLTQQNGGLASRLVPGTVPPGPKEAFLHHASVLSRVVGALRALPPDAAHGELIGRYDGALRDWPTVAQALGTASRADAWITPLRDGQVRYGRTEGF